MKPMRKNWDAWAVVAERTYLTVGFGPLTRPGGPVLQGVLCGDVIVIDESLNERDRYATLTHELIHDERQIFPSNPVLAAKEETVVRRITADRLCPLAELELLATGHSPDIETLLEHFAWCDADSLKIQLGRLAKRRNRTRNHPVAA